jgi:hypothetical protein
VEVVVMRKLLLSLLLIVLGVGCASGDDAAVGWGLDDVSVPTTQDEVNVVFLAMPAELEGMTAERDDPDHVGFVQYVGDDSGMGVSWQQVGDNDRATTVAQLEFIAGSDQFSVVSQELDAESGVVFLHGTAENDSEHLLYWGDPVDGQMFVFSADSAAHLDSLVEAFVDAAGGA